MRNQLINEKLSSRTNLYPLLTKADEKHLFECISQGCLSSRQTVLLSNMRLIYKEVKKVNGNFDADDLCSEGVIGLLRAIDGFDISLGYRFSTYATWWVREAIQSYIYKTRSSIAFPRGFEADRRKIMAARDILLGSGVYPTAELVAEKTKLSAQRVKAVLEKDVLTISETHLLSDEYGDDQANSIFDRLGSEIKQDETFAAAESQDIKKLIEKGLASLSHPEQDVIVQRYYKNEVQIKYLAKQLKMSSQRVFQIESKALKGLKKFLNKDGFDELSDIVFS